MDAEKLINLGRNVEGMSNEQLIMTSLCCLLEPEKESTATRKCLLNEFIRRIFHERSKQ